MQIRWRIILQIFFALALMVLGTMFFKQSDVEVKNIYQAFQHAHPGYLLLSVLVLAANVLAQAYVLRSVYQSVDHTIRLRESLSLYLKRFFLSPFIPGGFSAAQYTLRSDLDHHKIKPSEHTFASTLFVLISIGSYLVFLIPVAFLGGHTLLASERMLSDVVSIVAGLIGVAAACLFLFRHAVVKLVRRWLKPHVGHIYSKPIMRAFLASLALDAGGILLVWFALLAVGVHLPLEIAGIAYILTVLVLSISPLFQGFLIVESAMVFFLTKAGVEGGTAVAATLIFRGFQLWLPLVVSGLVYLYSSLQRTIGRRAS